MNDYSHLWQQFRVEAEPIMQRFHASHSGACESQKNKLLQLLNQSAATPIGQHYNFDNITSYDEYAAQVPVSNWGTVKRWVDKACSDSKPVLSSQLPLFFEPTSGSSAQRKLIPYTPALLSEFQSAIIVWLASLFDACPAIANGRGYWAMSPPTAVEAAAVNGIPISGGNDIVYLQDSIVMPLLASVLNPPQCDPAAQDWRTLSLIAMIEADDLTMVSSWSPTFLLTLLQPLLMQANGDVSAEYEQVLNSIASDRKSVVIEAVRKQNFNLLWPNLAVVSCWADGPSKTYAKRLAKLFPQSVCVPKGVWATEGVISLSYGISDSCPIALESHFYEFVADDGQVVMIDDLVVGQRYRPLLTTGGGFYRYDLGDIVEVVEPITTDKSNQTIKGSLTCVRYVGRVDARSDLVGEKLDESLARQALESIIAQGVDAALVPDDKLGSIGYVLLLQRTEARQADAVANDVEVELLKIHHYAQARGMSQLNALRVKTVDNVSVVLQQAWESLGKCAGDFKPAHLVTQLPLARALLDNLPVNSSDPCSL